MVAPISHRPCSTDNAVAVAMIPLLLTLDRRRHNGSSVVLLDVSMREKGEKGCVLASLPSSSTVERRRVELTGVSCAKQGLNPVQQFRDEVSSHFHGDLKGPFNVEDRAKAVSDVASVVEKGKNLGETVLRSCCRSWDMLFWVEVPESEVKWSIWPTTLSISRNRTWYPRHRYSCASHGISNKYRSSLSCPGGLRFYAVERSKTQ